MAFGAGVFLLFSTFVNTYGAFAARRKRITAVAVIVLAALLLVISGLLRSPIDLTKVDRMELYTYDHVSGGKVELTQAEQWMVAFLYNISPRGGEITGEPCCDAYRVEVYYQDGSEMHISEGVFSKMIVRIPREKGWEDFYVTCPFLVDYIYILAEKYDLPID